VGSEKSDIYLLTLPTPLIEPRIFKPWVKNKLCNIYTAVQQLCWHQRTCHFWGKVYCGADWLWGTDFVEYMWKTGWRVKAVKIN